MRSATISSILLTFLTLAAAAPATKMIPASEFSSLSEMQALHPGKIVLNADKLAPDYAKRDTEAPVTLGKRLIPCMEAYPCHFPVGVPLLAHHDFMEMPPSPIGFDPDATCGVDFPCRDVPASAFSEGKGDGVETFCMEKECFAVDSPSGRKDGKKHWPAIIGCGTEEKPCEENIFESIEDYFNSRGVVFDKE